MKKIIIPILVTLLLITGGAYWVRDQNRQKTEALKQQQNPEIQTTIVVDNGLTKDELKIVSGEIKTAFGLLQKYSEDKKVEMTFKQYDFGTLVESIGGKKNTPNLAWIYYVNGTSGSVGADQYQLQNGDTILWKYEKPKF